jgi:hypothetical protein
MNGNSSATVVTQAVTDPNSGITINVSFNRPTNVNIYVSMEVHLLTGGTSATLALIQTAVANYLNGLAIGAEISYGELVGAANSVNPVGAAPIYSVRAANFFFGTSSSPTTNTDIALAFYQNAVGSTPNVVITSV